jgi:hypothetical protein
VTKPKIFFLRFFDRWRKTNKSEAYMRNVFNRFAYRDLRSSFDNLKDDMIDFINSHYEIMPDTLLEVRGLSNMT